ncbi:MAG TPA: hypothetical protein VMT76_10695 [Puia sp.]|nr:hypothetical protein [Puia sp.]
MKKLYYLILLSGLFIIILPSCKKDVISNPAALPSSNAVNVVVAPNQTYQLNLSGSAVVNIFKQAAHYQTSETLRNSGNGSFIYTYVPESNFKGRDQVVLSQTNIITTSNNISGCPNSNHTSANGTATYSTTYTTINIIVSN